VAVHANYLVNATDLPQIKIAKVQNRAIGGQLPGHKSGRDTSARVPQSIRPSARLAATASDIYSNRGFGAAIYGLKERIRRHASPSKW